MIQRIQTLYLFGVSILMALFLSLPLATVTTSIDQASVPILFRAFSIAPQGAEAIVSTFGLGLLACLTLGFSLLAIFLYRKRWSQIRLCLVMGVLLLGVLVFEFYYLYQLDNYLTQTAPFHATRYSAVTLAPVLAAVLLYLAFRGISRDEALVRSIDRIR